MTEFRVKCAGNGNVKCALYDDTGSGPGSLLNSTGGTSVFSGWNTIPFTGTPINLGTAYWLAINSDASITTKNNDAGIRRYKSWSYSADFPTPAGTGLSSDTAHQDFFAGWATVTLPAPPAPPVIVTPKTTITFEWNTSSGATKYRLQVNTASDFTGTSMFDAEVSTTSQAVTLTVGNPYYWRVKAGNAGGWSAWSSTGSVTP
jgi:hypothetical protein